MSKKRTAKETGGPLLKKRKGKESKSLQQVSDELAEIKGDVDKLSGNVDKLVNALLPPSVSFYRSPPDPFLTASGTLENSSGNLIAKVSRTKG